MLADQPMGEINAEEPISKDAAFEIRAPGGAIYRIWADGRISGFDAACFVFNRIPDMLADAECRRESAELRHMIVQQLIALRGNQFARADELIAMAANLVRYIETGTVLHDVSALSEVCEVKSWDDGTLTVNGVAVTPKDLRPTAEWLRAHPAAEASGSGGGNTPHDESLRVFVGRLEREGYTLEGRVATGNWPRQSDIAADEKIGGTD